MTIDELLRLFRARCEELSQAEVARRIDCSTSTVSMIYHGKYRAAPDEVLRRFEREFCATTIRCPEMRMEISLKRCAEERATPLNGSSPRRIRMHRACRECDKRG